MKTLLQTEGIAHVKRGEEKYSTYPDICLQEGSCFGIFGQAGSGKRMLMKIASGILKPTHGTVQHYTSQRAYVFFETGLIHNYTAEENIRVALLFSKNTDNIEKRITDSLGKFDLMNIKNKVIDGLPETPLRLLQYARADALKPKLLFIEEPLKYIRLEQYDLIKLWMKDYVSLNKGACLFTSMHEDHWDYLRPSSLNLSGTEIGVITKIMD